MFAYCIYLPSRMWWVIRGNYERYDQPSFKENYGVFIDGIKTNTIYQAQYRTFEIVRRLFLIYFLVNWSKVTNWQVFFLIELS